jgi:hypothetical protein
MLSLMLPLCCYAELLLSYLAAFQLCHAQRAAARFARHFAFAIDALRRCQPAASQMMIRHAAVFATMTAFRDDFHCHATTVFGRRQFAVTLRYFAAAIFSRIKRH